MLLHVVISSLSEEGFIVANMTANVVLGKGFKLSIRPQTKLSNALFP